MMDAAFAKIVVDGAGRNHILIGGEIISLSAIMPDQRNNEIVEAIVNALRYHGQTAGGVNGAHVSAGIRHAMRRDLSVGSDGASLQAASID